jgi:hypothetical protein
MLRQESSLQTTTWSFVNPGDPSFGAGPKLYERRKIMNVKTKVKAGKLASNHNTIVR